MAETKKKIGTNPEYQSGCTRCGIIRKSAPSDDWCSVERHRPRIVRARVSRSAHSRIFRRPSHSNATGLNSSASTVRYSATHQPTSNITDPVPNE